MRSIKDTRTVLQAVLSCVPVVMKFLILTLSMSLVFDTLVMISLTLLVFLSAKFQSMFGVSMISLTFSEFSKSALMSLLALVP